MLVCPLTGILGIRIPEQDQRRNVQKCRVQVDKWPGTPLVSYITDYFCILNLYGFVLLTIHACLLKINTAVYSDMVHSKTAILELKATLLNS